MQISVLFAYCSGRNFNDSDLPLISKYSTRLILGCVIGPRGHEYLMSLRKAYYNTKNVYRTFVFGFFIMYKKIVGVKHIYIVQ